MLKKKIYENLKFSDVVKAYKDCRKHKSKSIYRAKFEYNLEENLYQLYEDLINFRYEINPSICFLVFEPKIREIWAGDFRDRIVHHLIYNKISEKYYKRFIKDTYSCIPKRGTYNGALAIQRYARKITQNYTKKAYYLKCDIKNFFVTIDKDILRSMLDEDDELLKYLLDKVIYNDLRQGAIIQAGKTKFSRLPKHKSLWNTPLSKGLPIGNLTSQFFSNVYLDKLDKFIKHNLHCKYYCRYVDDFIIMDYNPKNLENWYYQIKKYLFETLALELHTHKKMINTINKGIDFVGYNIKPNRMLLRQKTLHKMNVVMKNYKKNKNWFNEQEQLDFVCSANSYLGLLRGIRGYALRFVVCGCSINIFIQCDINYTKFFLLKNLVSKLNFKKLKLLKSLL